MSVATKQAGRSGEDEAAQLLTARGYRVVARNVRPLPGLARGEIDLIAWDGRTLVFVEVKTRRRASASPEISVGIAKRRQLVMLAEAYLSGLHDQPESCRFDVVTVWHDPSLPAPMLMLRTDAFDAQIDP
jgi:putative endonuclease